MHPATASTRHAGHARSNRRLVGGIAISVLLHALLLSLQFGVPGSDGGGSGPLSVVLAPVTAPVRSLAPVPPPSPTTAALPTPQVASPVLPPPPLPPSSAAPAPSAPEPSRGLRLVDLPPPTPPVAKVAPAPKASRRRPTPVVPLRRLRDVATPVIAMDANPASEFSVAVPLPEVDAGPPPAVADVPVVLEAVVAREMPADPEPVVDVEAEQIAQEALARRVADAAQEAALQQELALQQEQAQAQEQEQEQEQRDAADARRRAELQQAQDEQAQQRAQQQAVRDQEALQRQLEQQAEAARELAAQRAVQDALVQTQLQARQRAEDVARRLAQQAAERQRVEELAQRSQAEELARQQAAERQRNDEQAQRSLAEERAREQAAEQARLDAERLARGAAEEAARQAAQRLQAQASGPVAGRAAGPATGSGPAAARANGAGVGVGLGSGPGAQSGPGAMAGLPGNRARELLRGVTIPNVDAAGLPREHSAGNRRVLADGGERDAPLRLYVDSVRQKLERNAVLGGARLSLRDVRIDPLVSVSLRSDGSIDEITIVRSSGRADVDDAVRRFVRLNARYAAFPPNVAANFDVIEIRRIWRFVDGLKLVEEMR
jgi:hypothetical protein